MGLKRTDEFRADAVRIALTSGLSRKQVAADLGVGLSTLNKWVTAHRYTEVVSDKDLDLARENDRLRRENRILKEEREILKKATQFFAGQKPGGSGSSKNTDTPFVRSACATCWMSVRAVCGPIVADVPAKGSGATWWSWPTSKNNPVSAWAAMAGRA